jgi:hypothetical protein
MIANVFVTNRDVPWKSLLTIGIVLALGVAPRPSAAQQTRAGEAQANFPPPDSQDQMQSPEREQAPDSAPPQGTQPTSGQPDQPPPQAQPNSAVAPQSLTLPAGTVIRLRVVDWISTDRNVIGDLFSAELDQPIVVNGWVIARRGQAQSGRVSLAQKGHGGGSSQLGLELPELTLVDGQQIQLQTQLYQTSAGTDRGRDAAIVGTTTGMGAIIGAIAGRGVGAAIGAGIGATAGIAGVMSTPGKPTVIQPETVLSFRLQEPVTISTANSQFAFQPVSQSDYDSHSPQSRPRMVRPGPPPPPRYYGPYGYPYAYAYPYEYGYPYPYAIYPSPYVGIGYYGRFGRWR